MDEFKDFKYVPLRRAENLGYTHVTEDLEDKLLQEGIHEALNLLSERERICLMERYFNKLTFKEIGKKFGVSGERVGQIISKGLRKLRRPPLLKIVRKSSIEAEIFGRNFDKKIKKEQEERERQWRIQEEEWKKRREEQARARLEREKEAVERAKEAAKREKILEKERLERDRKRSFECIKQIYGKLGLDPDSYQEGTCPEFVKLGPTHALRVDPKLGHIHRGTDPETYDRWFAQRLSEANMEIVYRFDPLDGIVKAYTKNKKPNKETNT